MKKPIASFLIVLGSALALPASAQMGGGMGMGGMGMGGMAGPRGDCARAAVPADCEAHRQAQQEARATAREKCRDTAGAERRKCMREVTLAQTDCAKAADPKRCEAVKSAYQSCSDKFGPALRQCMRQAAPAPDCSRAADKTRCEAMAQARTDCGGPNAGDRPCLRGPAKAAAPAASAKP